MKAIAMFNNKGGVGKTTLLCNLAAYLQYRCNKKVLVIDADPQCNTTTYVLDEEQILNVYYDKNNRFTIADLVPPLKKGQGFVKEFEPIKPPYFCFDLVPGSPAFAADEDFLATDWKDVKSSELRGVMSTMLFVDFLNLCKDYDYVFFDMGPSLGAINRSILLACDYFITPMSADMFSLMALKNIGESIESWSKQFNNGIENLSEQDKTGLGDMKCSCTIKFLGYVEQQYIMKSDGGTRRAVSAYENILSRIPEVIQKDIVVPINKDMSGEVDYKLGSIPNFYSLVPMSQTVHKPIFLLTNTDGVVGAHYKKVKDFGDVMNTIAEKVLNRMGDKND